MKSLFNRSTVMSHNQLIFADIRPHVDTSVPWNLLAAGRWRTVIEAEHTDTYHKLVLPIMAGFVIMAAARNKAHPMDQQLGDSVFGFSPITLGWHGSDRREEFFIPHIDRSHVHPGTNATALLDTFHAELITKVNDALTAGESPYRLAPLPTAEHPQITRQ